jgi:hypothetical protein
MGIEQAFLGRNSNIQLFLISLKEVVGSNVKETGVSFGQMICASAEDFSKGVAAI